MIWDIPEGIALGKIPYRQRNWLLIDLYWDIATWTECATIPRTVPNELFAPSSATRMAEWSCEQRDEKLLISHSPGSLSFVVEACHEDGKPYPPCTIQNIMAGLYHYTKYKAPTGTVIVPNIKGLYTLNLESNRFSNRIAQCKFKANPMRINHVHTAMCGTEFTRVHWLQVAAPPHSYHGILIRSLLQPAIILLLELSRYVEHSV